MIRRCSTLTGGRFSSAAAFRSRFVFSNSLSNTVRFCASSSSTSTTETPTSNPEQQQQPQQQEIPALLKRCQELDEKCFSWSLTQQDIEEVVQTLGDISDGKIDQDALNESGYNSVVPYPDLEDPTKRGVEVPYSMSTLLRCVFSYPKWKTMTAIGSPELAGKVPPTEKMGLRRKDTPDRDYLAMPVPVCTLPASKDDPTRRAFILGSSDEKFEGFRAEVEQKFGGLTTESVTGYELFQLAQMTMYHQNKEQPEQKTQFHGISLNPTPERIVLLGSDPQGLVVAKNISCDAALENALVLVKWLVEESPKTVLKGHQGGFVSSCVSSVLERASYYVLQDKDGGAFIFTSMHHLLRYKSFAMKFAKDDWEKRGPWSVGTTEAANIDWVMGGNRSPVINPIAPGDEVAIKSKFPASNIQFSVPGIEQMVSIIDQMKKAMGGQQQQQK